MSSYNYFKQQPKSTFLSNQYDSTRYEQFVLFTLENRDNLGEGIYTKFIDKLIPGKPYKLKLKAYISVPQLYPNNWTNSPIAPNGTTRTPNGSTAYIEIGLSKNTPSFEEKEYEDLNNKKQRVFKSDQWLYASYREGAETEDSVKNIYKQYKYILFCFMFIFEFI